MTNDFQKSWRSVAIRGVLGILLGIAMLVWPHLGVVALIGLFGIFAIVDGVAAIAGAYQVPKDSRMWTLLALEGVVGISAGLVAFFWPGLTIVALVTVAGFWAIIVGIAEIAGAVRYRKQLAHDWLYALAGGLTVLFGLFILMRPELGGLALIYAIAFMIISHGATLLALGMRVRELDRDVTEHLPTWTERHA